MDKEHSVSLIPSEMPITVIEVVVLLVVMCLFCASPLSPCLLPFASSFISSLRFRWRCTRTTQNRCASICLPHVHDNPPLVPPFCDTARFALTSSTLNQQQQIHPTAHSFICLEGCQETKEQRNLPKTHEFDCPCGFCTCARR